MSSIERPVVMDVIRQLKKLTGIDERTVVRFYSDDARAPQHNSSMTKEADQNLWPHKENITIEVEESYAPERILAIAVKELDTPYIFVDPALNFTIKPVYSPTDVIIRVAYSAKDKNQANRWRNEVRTRIAMGREVNLHELNYSYHLPSAYVALLQHIYDLRSNIGSYGDTLNEWWAKCASDRFTLVTSQNGTNPTLTVAEKQSMVQGLFDFEGVPEKAEKADDPDLWTISFTYRFKYDKPVNTVCRYPLLVHQQLIGEIFRQDNNAKPNDQILKALSNSGVSFERFQGDVEMVRRLSNKGITIPYFDDWLPLQGTVPSGTLKVFTGMASITPEDKRTLLNLRELGDFLLVDAVLDFLAQSEYPYLTGHGSSVFQLTLYEGYNVLPPEAFAVDANLNVVATADLDLRKLYHVRLGLNANIVSLRNTALSRLLAWQPSIITLLATAMNGALSNSGSDRDLRKNALNAHDLALLGIKGNMLTPAGLFQTLFVSANRLPVPAPAAPTPVAINRPFVSIPG